MLTKRSTGDHSEEPDRSPTEELRKLTAAIEERDATIATLERTLAEERAHIETLRDALERAKFQTRILEQSYSTQLGEARERAAAAEQAITQQQVRIAELEASHKRVDRELADVRARLDSLGPKDTASIDELLAAFSVPREQPRVRDSADEADTPTDAQLLEEMLAPEVMFAAKGKKAAHGGG